VNTNGWKGMQSCLFAIEGRLFWSDSDSYYSGECM
jgi:hypothetical protein